jgi:hypothetical protein
MWLLKLYPASWRERYEEEVAQLIRDQGWTPGLVVDLVTGAIDAWRHPELIAPIRGTEICESRKQSTMIAKASVTLVLSALGLLFLYASLVAAEALSTTALALSFSVDTGVTGNLYRAAILSVTALPIAYLTGWALTRWAPVLSRSIILVVAVLYTLVVALLQFYLYSPTVLGSSLLKVLFVVVPLALVGYRARPEHVG